MPTSVALTPHLEGFIRSQVASGRYNNASEVVRDGLRMLERQQREEVLKLEALSRAAAAGFAELDASRFNAIRTNDCGMTSLKRPKRLSPRYGITMTMPSMTLSSFGDVVLAGFPFTSLQATKKRPVVVISNITYQQKRV